MFNVKFHKGSDNMCGRFTITVSKDTLEHYLQEHFDIDASMVHYEPNYNVAPSQKILSVIFDGHKYRVGYLNWGFVPPFNQSNESTFKMINARGESVDLKPSFKEAFKTKRCLILADGFYEWDRAKKNKQPYRFSLKNNDLFTFAGLYSPHKDSSQEVTFGSLIITVNANLDMAFLHDRLPVILKGDAQKDWLDSHSSIDKLKGLLEPLPVNSLNHYPVTKEVNKVSFNQQEAVDKIKL